MAEKEEITFGYAVGVQTFERIRETKARYIDKTQYVWKMVNTPAINFFLSRPRRFGKSLLADTLGCYFEGRKELFEGLYIYDKEKEWKKYPVIRLNLSNGKYYEKDRIHPTINFILEQEEEKFGITNPKDPTNYDARLSRLIKEAHRQTGEKVVIIIDEYDAPMLDSINNLELQDYIRERVRNLFSPLKAQEQLLRFVFLTGISKFSQLSVFSELNNLQQLTFDRNYEAVCGISKEELLTTWKPDIERLMDSMNDIYKRWGLHFSYDDIVEKLRTMYDGYHFSSNFTDIYCPWSLVNAFNMGEIMNFWFSTGTPSMLINVMRKSNISIQQIEHFEDTLERFDAPTERISDPIPVLFQSGYLTLKDYNPFENKYVVGFPNGEVREGFARSLYRYYMEDYVGSQSALNNAYQDLRFKRATIEQFIEAVRRWYAGIPKPPKLGGWGSEQAYKNNCSDPQPPNLGGFNEQLYQSLIYAALMGCAADVSAEDQTSDGRMDMVLKVPDAIYIFELKYGKTAEEAVEQILQKDYAVRFAADGRPVWAVGLNISKDRRTIDGYQIVQVKSAAR